MSSVTSSTAGVVLFAHGCLSSSSVLGLWGGVVVELQ